MRFESSSLMHLHGDSHGRKEPPVVPMTTHPTPFQREDVFDHALHRLHRLASLLAQSAVFRLIQDFDHRLTLCSMVTIGSRRGQQGHPALSLKLGKQLLIIRFPVHNDRRDHAAKMPGFQPQPFGFMSTVAYVLEGP
jgi:hypothetical protein